MGYYTLKYVSTADPHEVRSARDRYLEQQAALNIAIDSATDRLREVLGDYAVVPAEAEEEVREKAAYLMGFESEG